MNADPSAQRALLDLQALDSELAQLAHRRRVHPALADIAAATKERAEQHDEAVDIEARLSDIAAEQSRVEADIDMVRQREARNQQRLEAGGIPAKELAGLEHELATLKRRQTTLEDDALEVMERREGLDAELTTVRAAEEAAADRLATATQTRDLAFAEIDATTKERTAERGPLAATIPDDLLGLYDKIRATHDGIGAAALRQRRCEGCRIELSGTDLAAARAAAPDDVLRCDNCRRILVRTADSGL